MLTASHGRYDIQHVCFRVTLKVKSITRYTSRRKLFRTTTYLFDNFVANSTLSEWVSFAANSRWSAGIAWNCQWQPGRNKTCGFRWPRVFLRLYGTFRRTVTSSERDPRNSCSASRPILRCFVRTILMKKKKKEKKKKTSNYTGRKVSRREITLKM